MENEGVFLEVEVPLVALHDPRVMSSISDLIVALSGPPISKVLPVAPEQGGIITGEIIIIDASSSSAVLTTEFADPRVQDFFRRMERLGPLYSRYYHALRAMGPGGLTSAMARAFIPEFNDHHPKFLGAVAGYARRRYLDDCPVAALPGGGQVWVGFRNN